MEGKGIKIGEEEEGEEKKNKRKRSKSRLECWTLASGWSNPLFVLVKFIWCECVCGERMFQEIWFDDNGGGSKR